QYGLYTAMIAGFIIALTGGSRYSISGPTAAFVVILYPIAEKFGLGGLLIATFLSGVVLMLMAFARLGRFIEYIPESVTLGFTSGIAIVIATLQLKDFFGLQMQYPETYVEKIEQLALAMPDLHWPSLLVGGGTVAALLIWKKFSTFPQHIPALLVGYSSPGYWGWMAIPSIPSAAVSATCCRMALPAPVFRRSCRNLSGPGISRVPTASRSA